MIDPTKGEKFIFVGGVPRSGTTLVQNILDSHPDIVGGPEFHHLPDIIRLRDIMNRSVNRGRIEHYCSKNDVDKKIRFFIESFLYSFMKKYDAMFISEKTPANILIFPQLIELFPAAHFIFVIRDPRAVIASMLQVGSRAKNVEGIRTQDFTYSVSAGINYIKKCFKIGFSVSKIYPNQVLKIVYENLVLNPEIEIKKMCKFLNVEWHNDLLHPSKKEHPGKMVITYDIWYDNETYVRDPVPNEIDKWKKQINIIKKSIIFLSFYDNKDLISLGYDYTFKNLSKPNKIIYLMIGIIWRINNYTLHYFFSYLRKAHYRFYNKTRLFY